MNQPTVKTATSVTEASKSSPESAKQPSKVSARLKGLLGPAQCQ